MTKSVTAEQIYPVIIPQITSMLMLRVLDEITSTKDMTMIAPAKAEPIIPAEPMLLPLERANKSARATVSFAPDEMPSTKGPTIGLSKKV